MKAALFGMLGSAAMLIAAGPAFGAQAAAMHPDPDERDNLRVYIHLDTPLPTFALDGATPVRLGPMSVTFTRLEPGRHVASASLPDGARASFVFNLSADDLVESRGRPWWCLMAERHDGELTLFQLTTASCKRIADAAPDEPARIGS